MTYVRRYWLLLVALLFVTNLARTPVVSLEPANALSFEQLVELDATLEARNEARQTDGNRNVKVGADVITTI